VRHFPSVDVACLARPILYSKWLSRNYSSADKESLRKHVQVATLFMLVWCCGFECCDTLLCCT
jgi:hypothetical protein